jgi:hypothetical protein
VSRDGSAGDECVGGICDAAAEVARGAPVSVMNVLGPAVIPRLRTGSE